MVYFSTIKNNLKAGQYNMYIQVLLQNLTFLLKEPIL